MPSELVPLHRLEGSDAGPVWRRDTQLKVILDDDVDDDVDNDVDDDIDDDVDLTLMAASYLTKPPLSPPTQTHFSI